MAGKVAKVEAERRDREYVRVPTEIQQEISAVAARYDVPVRSLTRVLLCLGMECLRIDESEVAKMVRDVRDRESNKGSARALPSN